MNSNESITFKATITFYEGDQWTRPHFVVSAEAVGAGVDRPATRAFGVNTEALAKRLARAIEAGAVFYNLEVRTDVNGDTYLGLSSRVMAKYANADLKRLGF